MKLVLASQSPARQAVLASLGFQFECLPAAIDEKSIRDPDPEQLVLKLARAKAEAVLPALDADSVVLASDQVVVSNGQILEKPSGPEEARRLLAGYHEHPPMTITAVVVIRVHDLRIAQGIDRVTVTFRPIPNAVLDQLIEEGDILSAAGSFKIQNPTIARYITGLDGETESVMGLPKRLTQNLLQSVGIEAVRSIRSDLGL